LKELAQEIGAFHSDVEKVMKELHEEGAISVYIYEGEPYALVEDEEALDNFRTRWALLGEESAKEEKEEEKEEKHEEEKPTEAPREEPPEKKRSRKKTEPSMYQ